MAQAFVVDVNLRVQQVLGLEQVKQQLANIKIGGIGQTQKLSTGLQSVGTSAGFAGLSLIKTVKSTVKLGRSVQGVGKKATKAAKSVQNFGDQVFIAGKRYGAFIVATAAAFKVAQVIGAGTKAVIEFDQSMVSLSQIIGVSVDQLGDLSEQFLDLSVSTGTSAAEIATAAKLLAQAGFRGAELAEAVEQLAKVPLTPIFESMDQAVDGAIAAMRQFSDEGLNVEQVFDKMINVSNKYAASFPDIIEGLKRGGSAFQAIGGNLDEFIAAFTTIRSETRETASAVGTSIKTLSSRLADPKIIKFLETKNIRLIEAGQFVGPLEAMRRIGAVLNKTAAIQDRINISVKLGGRRQISRFIALSQNMEKNNEILEVSKNSMGVFSKVAEQGLQAIGVQIDQLIAKGKKLAIELGEDLFIPFIQGLTGAANSAIALLSALKPILPLLSKIGILVGGAALTKGIGGFLGPKIGKFAGPAAFSAAGGGLQGAKAGLGASPFVQAGLLIAASEAASSLIKMSEGADSLVASLVSYTGTIIAMAALMKGQTITGFLGKGGLFPGLGKLGGGLLTAGAIALPVAGILELKRSQQDLSEKIIKNTVQSIDEIKIDPIDPRSLQKGFVEFAVKIRNGLQQSIDRVDPFAGGTGIGEKITRSFAAGLRVLGNTLQGDFESLFRRGGVTTSEIEERFNEIIQQSPQFVNQMIDNISQAMSATTKEKIPSGRYALTRLAVERGATEENAKLFTKAIINTFGGLEEFNSAIEKNIQKISDEISVREKLVQFAKITIPPKLISQLFLFSKAVDKTARAISTSARLFETQVSEIEGGIQAPTFEFDFGTEKIKQFIKTDGLKELFSFTPDIPKFISGISKIENLLDHFIVNIGNLPAGADLAEEVDKFFDFQDTPQIIRDKFGKFFDTIAQDIQSATEGKLVTADEIKGRFEKEFADIGLEAANAAAKTVGKFLNSTFAQIQDELNRLATVRRLELAVPIRPETQAEFLRQQLQRAGITSGGFDPSPNRLRGTIEELELRRLESASRGGVRAQQGFLPTPSAGFFQGRGQQVVDIAGDERVREQVRNSFQRLTTDLSRARKELAELAPGAEGFLLASERAKELARKVIELQVSLEALDKVTQQASVSELQTLKLRQQFELQQTKTELQRPGKGVTPLEAQRVIFNLQKEHLLEQAVLQDKFDSIIEKDNSLRANLAKEISVINQNEAQEFDQSVNIFADSTRIQVTTAELMKQHIIDFGQSVVNFSNMNTSPGPISDDIAPKITSDQIRSGGTTIQQVYDEYNRLLNEGNLDQKIMLDIMKAILDRQEQVRPAKQESATIQKEQERDTDANEKIGQLTESLNNLRLVINEPNEIRLVSDQRIELDLSTLPSDVIDEVRPILEEASLVIAKTVTRKALESLAAKSDSEVSIAAIDTAQELI